MSQDHVALWSRFFQEVWNEGHEATIDELMSEDFELHGLGHEPVRGREAFRAWWKAFAATNPGAQLEVLEGSQSGDMVAVRTLARVQPAGSSHPVEFGGVGVGWVKDGQIVKTWEAWDTARLLEASGQVNAGGVERALAIPGAAGGPDLAAFWQRWFDEVWEQQRAEVIDDMTSADTIYHVGDEVISNAGFRAWREGLLRRFASVKGRVLDPIAQGDRISVRTEVVLTERDGQEHRLHGQQRAVIREGKFVEVWDAWDWSPVLEASGAVSEGTLASYLTPPAE